MTELHPEWGRPPGRQEILDAWRGHCLERAVDPAHCSLPEAAFLVTALGPALRRGAATPALARAGRSWGSTFTSPAGALASLACLREALAPTPGDLERQRITPAAHHRVLDQLMTEAVEAASASLRAAARTDPMTGCANRLALNEELGRAVRAAVRSGLDLAVVVIDLDGLKQVNDTDGHAAGDASLLALVGALRAVLRRADTLYRIGGDEFVVVAPFTDPAGAAAMLRRAEHSGAPAFSWGVASLAGTGLAGTGLAAEDPQLLLMAADTDLYVRRREWRRAQSRAASHRRRAVLATVAASVALTATGAVALTSDLVHSAGDGTGVTGQDSRRTTAGAGSAPFHWPRAILATPGPRQDHPPPEGAPPDPHHPGEAGRGGTGHPVSTMRTLVRTGTTGAPSAPGPNVPAPEPTTVQTAVPPTVPTAVPTTVPTTVPTSTVDPTPPAVAPPIPPVVVPTSCPPDPDPLGHGHGDDDHAYTRGHRGHGERDHDCCDQGG